METMQRTINVHQIYTLTFVKFCYKNLGRSLIICLLLLIGFAQESARATDDVISENIEPQLSGSENIKASAIISELDSQASMTLRERLLASKISDAVVENNSDLNSNIEQKTFSNFGDRDNFGLVDIEHLTRNDNLEEYVVAAANSNSAVYLQGQGEYSPDLGLAQPSQILGQIDSSTSVGDSFRRIDKLRQQFLIDPIVTQREPSRWVPASSAGTPSAYGAGAGQAYIGGGLYFPFDKANDRNDGSLSMGFGVGNPFNSVGLEVNINITSVGGGPGFDFGDSGGVGFKLHRYLGDNAAVAIGWSNPIKWGDVNLAEDTIYGVYTRSFPLQPNNLDNDLDLTVSLGLGTGAFRSKGAIQAEENSLNFFAGLGLRVLPQLSLISSWTGNILNIGTSLAPFRNTPIIINVIIADVTENLSTGSGLSVSAGYIFEF
jgi:hypothetical protein